MNEKVNKRYCCYISPEGEFCPNTPMWTIWVIDRDPYDCWDSCDEHIADILTDAQIHEIHRLPQGENNE